MALCSISNVSVPCLLHDGCGPIDFHSPLVLDTGRRFAVRGRRPGTAAASPLGQERGVTLLVDPTGKRLVDACAVGDRAARRQFQAEFLPLIYRFEGSGGGQEVAGHDFLSFLFQDDRLYRRLESFRGAAPLRTYLWSCILPDLLKQFRAMIRRRRLDTVSLDEHAGQFAEASTADPLDTYRVPAFDAASLLQQLSPDKRVLLKLLYIEDFDIETPEVQLLANRSGRPVREVLERIEAAREVVRSREATQRARLDGAESAGQWIRLYERRLAQLEEDLAAIDSDSPRAVRLRAQRAEFLQKLDKRRRQRTERLRLSSHTIVTLPTEMLADLLGQPASSTRSQIARVRQEVAALLSGAAGRTPQQKASAEYEID